MYPIVKICGLMRGEDVRMCAGYGADILGFVVEYPRPVPWNLSIAAAKELIASVPKPAKSCVVTGGAPAHVLGIAMKTKPDYIQLHCGESLENTEYLVGQLRPRGIKVIKTLFPDTPDLEKTVKRFCATGVHALLYDPRTPDNAVCGGAADLSIYSGLRQAASCPVILAGGITPANAAVMIRKAAPEMIDLMTGVERTPGVKDETKVAALFQAMNA
jgi:phosphoribosylanthranilate isomerase